MTTVEYPIRICCILFLLLALCPPAQADLDRQAAALKGLRRMFDEDYTGAHATFDSLIASEPERPEGYLGRAMSYWEASLLIEGGDRHDREIRRLLKRAVRACEAHIRAHGESAEMRFWLGNIHGLRAGLEMTRGRVIEGVLDGLKSRAFLSEAVRLDPDLADAHFGLGLADYVIARQPRLLRMVSRLFSLPAGDREGGLAQLDRVAREGVYCRMHAISSRAFIALYYEKDALDARRRFAALLTRSPNSLDYRLRYLDALLALTISGKRAHAGALIDSVGSIQEIAAGRGWTLTRWTRTKLTFIEGLGHYLTGASEWAREHLETYVWEAEKKSWLLGPAELMLGKLADLRGERTDAVAHYRRARKHENVWGTRAEAEAYLNHPFSGDEPQRRPPDLEKRYPERP